MIRTITATLFLTFATSAFAAGPASITCKENGTGIDNGYQITVSYDMQSAVVETQSIAGPKLVAKLNCEALPEAAPQHPEMGGAFLQCDENVGADAGMTITLSNAGYEPLITGDLEEETIAGPKKLAAMTCVFN